MPRSTHVKRASYEDPKDQVGMGLYVKLDPIIVRFLVKEAHRLGEKYGKKYRVTHLVKALITAYYEKRAIGLLDDPDD